MPIFRWIIIGLAVWLAVVVLRRLIAIRQQKTAINKNRSMSAYSETVACHHCNLHIPKAEALLKNGRYYCSTKCRTEYRTD